uniref:Putative secreted protein n=1 Tax=Ixodes ricinus TaxID=34613 RepID=A0A6B0UPB6_IXORI
MAGHLFRMPGLQHVLVAFCHALAARARPIKDCATPTRYRRLEARARGGTTGRTPRRSRSVADYRWRNARACARIDEARRSQESVDPIPRRVRAGFPNACAPKRSIFPPRDVETRSFGSFQTGVA